MTRDAVVRLATRWGDVPVGSVGRIVRSWTTPAGPAWAKVEWGRNLTGQPIRQSYPVGALEALS